MQCMLPAWSDWHDGIALLLACKGPPCMPLFTAAQVLLKLQAANNLQRALKWVSCAGAAAPAAAAATAAALHQMPAMVGLFPSCA